MRGGPQTVAEPTGIRAAEIPAPRLTGVGLLTGEPDRVTGPTGLVPAPTPAVDGDRFRRATRECLLAMTAARAAVGDAGLDARDVGGERTGVVYVTACAYAGANRAFLEDERSTTLHFPYTSPSAVSAEVTIELGIRGPYVTLAGGGTTTLGAVWYAAGWLADGLADRVLVLAVETMAEVRDLFVRARRLYRPPLVEGAACLVLEPGAGWWIRWASAVARASRASVAVAGVLDAVLREARPAVVAPGAGAGPLARAEARVLAARGVDHTCMPEARAGEGLACGPLVSLARARASGAAGPCLVTAAWRGEYAALLWPFS